MSDTRIEEVRAATRELNRAGARLRVSHAQDGELDITGTDVLGRRVRVRGDAEWLLGGQVELLRGAAS